MIKLFAAILFIFYTTVLMAVNDSILMTSGRIEIGTNTTEGNLINWNEPESMLNSYINIEGIKTSDRSYYFGHISYNNKRSKGTVWPLQAPELFPYWILDNTKKNFVQNSIQLKGTYAYSINNYIKVGSNAEYEVSDAYNQTDPRYNSVVTITTISLPVSFFMNQLQVILEPLVSHKDYSLEMFYKVDEPEIIYQSLGLGHLQNPERITTYDSKFSVQGLGSKLGIRYKANKTYSKLDYKFTQSDATFNWSHNNWSTNIPIAHIYYIKNEAKLFIQHAGNAFTHTITLCFSNEAKTGSEVISREQLLEDYPEPIWVNMGTNDNYFSRNRIAKFSYDIALKPRRNHALGMVPEINFVNYDEKYFDRFSYSFKKQINETGATIYFTNSNNNQLHLEAGFKAIVPTKIESNAYQSVFKELIYDKELKYYKENIRKLSFKFDYEFPLKISKQAYLLNLLFEVNHIYNKSVSRTSAEASIQINF